MTSHQTSPQDNTPTTTPAQLAQQNDDQEHGDLLDEQLLEKASHSLGGQPQEHQGELNPQFKSMVQAVFSQVPLLKLLGVEVIIDGEEVRCEMDNSPDKIGNTVQNILHGGVTASLLDTIGGIVAMLAVAKRMDFSDSASVNANAKRLSRFATLDMRVDYLAPGRGERFIATAEVVRAGSRSCTTRMLLVNEKGEQIAIGTGSYVY